MPTPNAEYMREYRQTPAGRAQLLAQRRREQAKRTAIRRLITHHPEQFKKYFLEELAKLVN